MARTTVYGPLAFTGTNGTDLEVYDTSFSIIQGSGGIVEIQGNKLGTSFQGLGDFSFRQGGTYSGDQWVKQAVSNIASAYSATVAALARMSADTGSGADWYGLRLSMNGGQVQTTEIVKCVNGSVSSLQTITVTWADGDTMELEAIANGGNCDLKAYKNGVQIGTTQTDSSSPLTGGKPGLLMNTVGVDINLDNWEAGDITASGGNKAAAHYYRNLIGAH